MKYNKRTTALLATGLISLAAVAYAEEKTVPVVLTALSSTTLSGYVDTSAHWNFGTGNADLPPYTPNGALGGTKADGFNLNVVALTLTKAAESGGWSAGYNATLLFGPDALGYNPSVTGTASDFSLKDTYVDLHAPLGNGLDVKIGTYTEILGYEVFETGNNPNYTRSYGYTIEPTQMTGVLAAYQFSDAVSVNAGICDTWSAGVNARSFPAKAESFKTYMASITFTAPTNNWGFLGGSTLSGGIINGYDAINAVDKTSWYVGGTFSTPISSLKVGLAYDYVMFGPNTINTNAGPVNSGYQIASAIYLLWTATEKLTSNTRVDYFSQSEYLASSGLPKRAFAVTETLQYDLWKNVLARAEFRWDHATDDTSPYSTGRDNAYLLAANIIYKF